MTDYQIPNPKSPSVLFMERYEGKYLHEVTATLCKTNKYEEKPVEEMECYCCHSKTLGRQWKFREKGFTICEACLPMMKKFTLPLELLAFYGIEHVHYSIKKES